MFNQHFHLTNRIAAILLALLIAPFAFTGCNNDDSDSNNSVNNSSNNAAKKGSSFVIGDSSETITSEDVVSMTNATVNASSGAFSPIVTATRIYTEDGQQKSVTTMAQLKLIGTPGSKVEKGSYTLVENIYDADSKTMISSLKIESISLKNAPQNVTATAGTLEIKSINYEGDTATSISLQYDGTFRSNENDDTKEYKLSGSIKVPAKQ